VISLGTLIACDRPKSPHHEVARANPYDEVSCLPVVATKPLVLLTAGQSNAANHGESLSLAPKNVYSLFEGKCYVANDPQAGATGHGGSPWPQLGGMLTDSGFTQSVLLVNCASTSTKATDWLREPGPMQCVTNRVSDLRNLGLRVGYVLWHQGEADAMHATPAEQYEQQLGRVLRHLRERTNAVGIFVAQTSICSGSPKSAIRAAQLGQVDAEAGIFRGPDTDEIGMENRHDRCHFSKNGLNLAATMWFTSIQAQKNAKRYL
jgi:Carbohydrate esterase, sialic acid-specific acetylesterase